MAGGQAQLFLFGQGIGVVAAPLDDALHQFVAVGGDVLDTIAGPLQGVQKVDGRRRGIQAHGVADAGILGGVVAEDDGNALVGVGLAAQGGVAGGQPGQVVHAVGHGNIALDAPGGQTGGTARSVLLEGHGHRDDASVEFREGNVHRRVNRSQAQGTLFPIGAAAGADDALDDGHVQPVQQLLRPAGGYRCAGAALLVVQVAHGQAHGVDDAVHPWNTVGVHHVVGQSVPGVFIVLGLVLQAVRKNRQYVDVLLLEAANQVVNEGQVAAHPVGAVKEHSHRRAIRGKTLGDEVGNGRAFDNLRVIDALPGHGRGRFVAVVAAQVGVGKEQEEVAEVEDAAAHQIRKNRFHFRHGRGAGGDQVFIPLLVSGAGD